MPIASRTPKSCTIGTLEIFTVTKAITAATVAVSSGGPMWAQRLGERVATVTGDALLLDPVLHLDRELDAQPDQDRAARRW